MVGAALLVVLVYAAAMVASSRAVRRIAAGSLPTDLGKPQALMVAPLPGTPFEKEIIVAAENGYAFGRFDWLARPRLEFLPERWPLLPSSEVVDAALRSPCISGFVRWARFPVVEVREVASGYDVDLLDLRYSRRSGASFGEASLGLDRDLQPRN